MSNVEGNKIYSSSTCLEIIMRYFIHFLIHSLNFCLLFCCQIRKNNKFSWTHKTFFNSAEFFLYFLFFFSKKKSVPDFLRQPERICTKKYIYIYFVYSTKVDVSFENLATLQKYQSANVKFWMNEFLFSLYSTLT